MSGHTPGGWLRPYWFDVVYDDALGCIVAIREDSPSGAILAIGHDESPAQPEIEAELRSDTPDLGHVEFHLTTALAWLPSHLEKEDTSRD
jgi:hypothetical protein